MNDANPVPQILGMLVFREYLGPEEMRHTIGCLRLAADCIEGKLALEERAAEAALAAARRDAAEATLAAEQRAEARRAAAAAPKRKRGRPAKDPARVREANDPAALTLDEAQMLEARQDAARQHRESETPPLFFDPPQAAAD